MRNALAIAAFLLLSGLAMAAGQYDGIWALDVPNNTDYFSIHQQGNVMIITNLDNSLQGGGWDAYRGVLTDTSANADLLVSTESGGRISIRIDFSGTSNAILTMTACKPDPGTQCPWPVGTTFSMIRIF